MHIYDIKLDELYPKLPKTDDPPTLRAFIHEGPCQTEGRQNYPALLILPGGGYNFCNNAEGEPVATKFYSLGFNCYVLIYTCKPHAYYPTQLLQTAAAIHLIRTREDWNNSGHVSVIGFSAGGHLAGHISSCWDMPLLSDTLECESETLRVNAMILCYPGAIFEKDSHRGSITNLFEEKKTEEEYAALDIRKHIRKGITPPAFLWHTEIDSAVPTEDSFRVFSALRKAGIPSEIHVFPEGEHGFSVADRTVGRNTTREYAYIRRWVDMVMEWEKYMFPEQFE